MKRQFVKSNSKQLSKSLKLYSHQEYGRPSCIFRYEYRKPHEEWCITFLSFWGPNSLRRTSSSSGALKRSTASSNASPLGRWWIVASIYVNTDVYVHKNGYNALHASTCICIHVCDCISLSLSLSFPFPFSLSLYLHMYIYSIFYIYIYVSHIKSTYIHTCMHAYMHAYTHTYTHACMHRYIDT